MEALEQHNPNLECVPRSHIFHVQPTPGAGDALIAECGAFPQGSSVTLLLHWSFTAAPAVHLISASTDASSVSQY